MFVILTQTSVIRPKETIVFSFMACSKVEEDPGFGM
jgi:hypothetical protein